MEQIRKWTGVNGWPLPQPVSLERKHIPILKSNRYFYGFKYDGMRCMVAVGADPNILLFNRSMAIMASFKLRGIPKYAEFGTILDCEMVGNDIYVFDAFMVSGKLVHNQDLDERLKEAHSLVKSIIYMKNDTYRLKMKQYYTTTDFMKNGDAIPTDGFIFTPVKSPLGLGTQWDLFKWKPLSHITIDFEVKDHALYLQKNGTLTLFSNKYKWPKDYDNCIVECGYKKGRWYPIKVRDDKSYPNSEFVFSRTMVNIKEDIKIEELII